jgi:hypothetical protein
MSKIDAERRAACHRRTTVVNFGPPLTVPAVFIVTPQYEGWMIAHQCALTVAFPAQGCPVSSYLRQSR